MTSTKSGSVISQDPSIGATVKPETGMSTFAVHRSFEANMEGKREPIWYLCNANTVTRLSGKKIDKFIAASAGRTIRMSAVNSNDFFLLELERVGASILYSHWHALGIEKGQEPEAIAAAIYTAPAELFRQWVPRQDLVALRDAVSLFTAMLEYVTAARLKFQQVGRNMGLPKGTVFAPEEQVWLDELEDGFGVTIDEKKIPLIKNVERIARTVPECVLFKEVAGIKGGWGTAAQLVAWTGGCERFDSVAAFWKYCGQHVVDGKVPRRKKGTTCDWSTRCRATLFNLIEMSINRHRNNKWYPVLEEYRVIETAKHATAPEHACKKPKWHVELRARRRVAKDILKEFFVKAKGLEFRSGHHRSQDETQNKIVVPAAG